MIEEATTPIIIDTMGLMHGIDVSRHQGIMDWTKPGKQGAKFFIARASLGMGGKDDQFDRNIVEGRKNGLAGSAYHLVMPDYGWKDQYNNFLKVAGPYQLDFAPVLDCEMARNQYGTTITNCIWNLANALSDKYGKATWIYTGAGWWNTYVIKYKTMDWNKFPLHVANYTTAPEPLMPYSWRAWTTWQRYADGDLLGPAYGAGGSKSIDINLCKLTLEQLTNGEIPVVVPPTPDNTKKAEVLVNGLRVRNKPSVYGAIMGAKNKGDIVTVYQEVSDGNDTWLKIDKDKSLYIAMVYKGSIYVRYV